MRGEMRDKNLDGCCCKCWYSFFSSASDKKNASIANYNPPVVETMGAAVDRNPLQPPAIGDGIALDDLSSTNTPSLINPENIENDSFSTSASNPNSHNDSGDEEQDNLNVPQP